VKLKNATWALADQALVSGSSFLLNVLLARLLGLEQFGIYSLLLLAHLFCAGLQNAIIISPMMTLGQKSQNGYYANVLLMQAVLAASLGLVMYFSLLLIINYTTALVSASFSLFIVAKQLHEFMRKYFYARAQSKYHFSFTLDSVYLVVAVPIIIYLSVHKQLTLNSVFFTLCFALTASLFSLIMFRGHMGFGFGCPKASIGRIAKKHYSFGKWLTAQLIIQWIGTNYYYVVAAAVFGPVATGALKAAQNIAGAINVLFLAIENVVPAQASKIFFQQGNEQFNIYLTRIFLCGVGLTLAVSVVIAFSSEWLMPLVYGDEYRQYAPLLVSYSFYYVIIFLPLLLRIKLRSLEFTRPIFTSYIITFVMSLLIAKFVISHLGLHGAILGMSVQQIVATIWLYVACSKSEKQRVVI